MRTVRHEKERVGNNGLELAEQGSDDTANGANAAEIAELELVLETAVHIHNIVAELHKRGTLEGFSEHISDHVGGLYKVRSENEQKDSAFEELGAPLVVSSARRSALLLDGGEEGLVISEDRSRPGDAATVIGEEIADENSGFGAFRADSGLGLVRARRNDFEAVSVPVDGAIVVHNDVPTDRAGVRAPRALSWAQ